MSALGRGDGTRLAEERFGRRLMSSFEIFFISITESFTLLFSTEFDKTLVEWLDGDDFRGEIGIPSPLFFCGEISTSSSFLTTSSPLLTTSSPLLTTCDPTHLLSDSVVSLLSDRLRGIFSSTDRVTSDRGCSTTDFLLGPWWENVLKNNIVRNISRRMYQ